MRYPSTNRAILFACCLASLQAAHLSDDVKKNAAIRISNGILQHAKDATNIAQRNGFWSADTQLDLIILQIGQATAGPGPVDPDMAAKALVPVFESARTDKQVGSGASVSGSTNLVSKGSLPTVLGFAVENGALTRSVSGTTVTFQGSPVGILNALENKGYVEGYRDDAGVPFLQFLRRTAFSVSFDTNRDAPTPTTSTTGSGSTATAAPANPFTASSKQLSEYSFRLSLINKRDPRHPSYTPLWQSLAAGALDQTGAVASQVVARVRAHRTADMALDAKLKTWQAGLLKALQDSDGSEAAVNAVVTSALTDLESITDDLNAFSNLEPYAAAVRAFSTGRNKVLKRVAQGMILTYDFATIRQLDNPDLLNHKLIFETDLLKNGKSDFTVNASFTHFANTNGLPAHTKAIRDYQFAAQLDVPVASVIGSGGSFDNWMLSGSWRYMRLLESQKIPLTDLTAPTGVVNLVQGKLTVPVRDGVKIPFAVTWSNRTELVAHKSDFRVNLGVLLDAGVLFSKLKP